LARPRARVARYVGRADVRGQVGEVARERHAAGDALGLCQAAPREGRLAALVDGDPEPGELRRRGLLAALEVRDAVEHGSHGERREARRVVGIHPGRLLAGDVQDGVARAGLLQPLGGCARRAPERLAGVILAGAEADQQRPLGLAAAEVGDRQRFAALARKVAAADDTADQAT
jgi:hypothetical protein